ncbi:MAG: DNA topoisomerase VI subunit B [Candidatus Nezhaarchaeales archaeon]
MVEERFKAISAADFFYRNKEVAGFDNPVRSTYTICRELIENSMDACEDGTHLPDVYVRLLNLEGDTLEIKVEDNGKGVPKRYVEKAFGQILFGSKYTLRQTRGIFGLGGKMAVLYGQITTNSPVVVTSSTGGMEIYTYELMVDIQRNEPITKRQWIDRNYEHWHGTSVKIKFTGDYTRAKPKIIEYLKHVAIIEPYAKIAFVDPDGILYFYHRKTVTPPKPPTEVLPHPHGVDVETVKRALNKSKGEDLLTFLTKNFHRVGVRTAKKFLKEAGFNPSMSTDDLKSQEHLVVKLVKELNSYKHFLPPDASCLSPIGVELLRVGIMKELNPEFIAVVQRKPSAYSGHPFIVEAAIAYGGNVPPPPPGEINLYRFANKIPLLYDSHNDVSMKVIRKIKWWRYKINLDGSPIAFFVHLCSTKIPYKTVGKEYIADQPEIEYNIEWAFKECARQLRLYLSKKGREEAAKRKKQVLSKYLPYIVKFSAELAQESREVNIDKLLSKHTLTAAVEEVQS